MTSSLSTRAITLAIERIDEQLTADRTAVQLYIDRGQLLELLGRKDDAVAAYIDVLRIEPTNVEALNALGLLFLAVGNREAAKTVLCGAVLHGPDHAPAHANLAYLQMLDGELERARTLYEHALGLDPQLAIAHHGLAEVLPLLDDPAGGAKHRALGLRYRPVTIERYVGESEPVRVLALGTAALGNIPTAGYFDNAVFQIASVTVEYADAQLSLPPHDIIFNTIGEADLCQAQLELAAAIVGRSTVPVLNDPAAVAATTRVANADRLRALAGVRTAATAGYPRVALTDSNALERLAADGFGFPLLVRAPGFHTGDHFVKVDSGDELSAAVATLPGDDLLVIEYLDLGDATHVYRKYRVIIVDGRLYPLHLAVSHSWKVHYFSAAMADCPEYRAEDAAFLADMRALLGDRVLAALERVRETLALDYGGIDFTLDSTGDGIIVFEANASMIVPLPGPESLWDYRRRPVARIRSAIRDMLVRRSARPTGATVHAPWGTMS